LLFKLQQAVAGGDLHCTAYLSGLPVMGELSCDDVFALLTAAAGSAQQTHHSNWIFTLLCR
jgi:hypothetical protein